MKLIKSSNKHSFTTINTKSQAAMEFLMTYGWALLLVIIVIGSLVFFGLLNPERFLPEKADLGTGLTVLDSTVSENGVQFLLQNNLGRVANNVELSIEECDQEISDRVTLLPGETELVTVHCNHDLPEESLLSGTVTVNYTSNSFGETISHVSHGTISNIVGSGLLSPLFLLSVGEDGANDQAEALSVSSDGSFYVAGHSRNYGGSDYDAFLMKFNSAGTEIWNITIGDASSDYFYAVQVTSDGGVIGIGQTASYAGDNGDVLLSKFDSNGAELWTSTLSVGDNDKVSGGIQTSDGGYVVIGRNHTGVLESTSDGFVAKFDSSGNEVWTKGIDIETRNYPYNVIELSNGNLLVAGNTLSGSDIEIFISVFSSSGVEQWTKTHDSGASQDYYGTLVAGTDGNFYYAGDNNFIGNWDFSFAKFNSSGDEVWSKEIDFDEEGVQGFQGLTELSDGTFVATGAVDFSGLGSQLVLANFNSSGDVIWFKSLGNTVDDLGEAAQITPEGDILIVGYTEDSIGTNRNLLVAKFDPFGNMGDYVNLTTLSASSYTVTDDSFTSVTETITEEDYSLSSSSQSISEAAQTVTVVRIYDIN